MPNSNSAGYKSPKNLAKWTTLALKGVVVVNVVNFLLPQSGDKNAALANLVALLHLVIYGLYAAAVVVSYLAAAVGFIMWLVRVRTNLSFLGVQDVSSKTWHCIWGFFIPIFNLYKPYTVIPFFRNYGKQTILT